MMRAIVRTLAAMIAAIFLMVAAGAQETATPTAGRADAETRH